MVLFPCESKAQLRLFKKKSQAVKATRELEKRRVKAGQNSNSFNPLQPMGGSRNTQRDDFIWSDGTAYITARGNGNLSVATPSRLGIRSGYELQSLLGADYWVPNVMLKKGWQAKTWWWASRHGIYSAFPGLEWAQKRAFQSVVDSTTVIPPTLTLRNELMVSRPFFNALNCNSKTPYLVLSAAVAADYGLSFKKNELVQIREHIVGSRYPALTGNGLLVTMRLQADANLTDALFIRGNLKYLMGEMRYNAFEHEARVEYLFSSRASVSGGYIFSVGKYASSTLGVLPFIDICFYFGRKAHVSNRLFEQPMF
ncbi:hypothetical protein ACT3CD_00510 [Geofilum sp. OHC36d9]|uniref:hypothetical protein n=1 Tax=Geofilum sp. OHC36d9 TaxID=3458413 RepID=UPI0040340A29